jgi:hypothetical protein
LSHLWGLGVVTCCVLHYITTLYLSLSALSVSSRSSSLLLTKVRVLIASATELYMPIVGGTTKSLSDGLGKFTPPATCFDSTFTVPSPGYDVASSHAVPPNGYFLSRGVDHACYPIRFQSGVVYSPAVCPQSHTGAQTNINLHGDITVTRIAVAQSECRPCCRQFALVNSTVFRRVPGASPE